MKSIYYTLATLTAFFCLNMFYVSEKPTDFSNYKVQHIDMSDYVIHINPTKGK